MGKDIIQVIKELATIKEYYEQRIKERVIRRCEFSEKQSSLFSARLASVDQALTSNDFDIASSIIENMKYEILKERSFYNSMMEETKKDSEDINTNMGLIISQNPDLEKNLSAIVNGLSNESGDYYQKPKTL